MKAELRQLLEEIGYSQALRCNRSLMFHSWTPGVQGDHLFKDKTEAQDCMKSLQKLKATILDTPERLLDLIGGESRTPNDWDQGRNPLVDVAVSIGRVQQMAKREMNETWGGPGPSPKVAGRDAALKLAEIYVLGTGNLPGSGVDSDGNPTGTFPKFVKRFFEAAEIKENFRRPCQHAVKALTANNNREFHRLLTTREANGARISLVTGRTQSH